ncbi:MAG: transporter substrate-binding domain-containing protein [Erysipelothrix sp.]|nr:transporter substrate-binding domain-containing protein [Erysipelothrix sp.]
MKKSLILIISVILLALSACAPQEELPALKVGMDLRYPPFETVDSSSNPSGISVDIAKELGEFMGREIEIVDLPFGSLITSLQTGEIDIIIASMSITPARQETIDFTNPYVYFPLVTLANKAFVDANNIQSIDDVLAYDGVKFAGQKGTVFLDIPTSKAANPGTPIETDSAALAVIEVTTGAAQATVLSLLAAASNYKANPASTVLFLDALQVNPIGMGVKKGNEELLQKANEFIASMESEGVNTRLREKYNPILLSEYLLEEGFDLFLTAND